MVNRLIKDIRNSLMYECYFTALSLALALPDICDCETEMCSFEDNIATPYLSGEVIYNLRNTNLH